MNKTIEEVIQEMSQETSGARPVLKLKKDAFTSPNFVKSLKLFNDAVNAEFHELQDQLDPGTYYLNDLVKLIRGGIINFTQKRKFLLHYLCGKMSKYELAYCLHRLGVEGVITHVNVPFPSDAFTTSIDDSQRIIPLIEDMGIYSLWKLEARWRVPKKLRRRFDVPETRETVSEFEFTVPERVDNRVKRFMRMHSNSVLQFSELKGRFNLSEKCSGGEHILFTCGREMMKINIDDVNITKGNPNEFDVYIKTNASHYLRGRCKCSISQWTERYSEVEYKVQRTVVTNERGEITSYTSRLPQDGSQLTTIDSWERNIRVMPFRDVQKYACHVADIYCRLDRDTSLKNQEAMKLISQLSTMQENIINPFAQIIKSSFPGVEITFPDSVFGSFARYEELIKSPENIFVPFNSNYKMPIRISNTQLRFLYKFTKLSIYQWKWKGDDGTVYLNTFVRSVHIKEDSMVKAAMSGARLSSKDYKTGKYCYSQVLETDE